MMGTATEPEPPPEPTPKRPKRLSKLWLLIPVLVLIVGVGVLYGLYRLRVVAEAPEISIYEVTEMSFPVTLVAKGEIKAKKNTEIRCQVEGRSTIVWLIEEGKQVEEGDLLVELANDGGGGSLSIDDRIKQQEIAVAKAKAELENAENSHEIQLDKNRSDIRKASLKLDLARIALEKYEQGDAVQAQETAKLNREEAEEVLRREEADLKISKRLYERGYITKTEHENDEFTAYKAKLELQKAKLAKEIQEKYTHQLDLRQKQSDYEEAEKDLGRTKKSAEAEAAQSQAQLDAKKALFEIETKKLTKLQEQRNKLKIYAPGPGMVVYHRSGRYWDDSREIEVGATVHERQWMIDLPDPSVMEVEVKINEAKMDKLELGLPATVEVGGIAGEVLTGKVTKIGVLAESQSRWLNPELKEYLNKITLDKTHPDLKPGMSAKVEILVNQLENVLAVPVQCVYNKAGHTYVFINNGETQYKEVELGLASTEYVEVLKGLSAGDKVCLVIDEDMKRLLPTDVGPSENGNGFAKMMMPGASKRPGADKPRARRTGGKTPKPGAPKQGPPRTKAPQAGATSRPGGAAKPQANKPMRTSRPKTAG